MEEELKAKLEAVQMELVKLQVERKKIVRSLRAIRTSQIGCTMKSG